MIADCYRWRGKVGGIGEERASWCRFRAWREIWLVLREQGGGKGAGAQGVEHWALWGIVGEWWGKLRGEGGGWTFDMRWRRRVFTLVVSITC